VCWEPAFRNVHIDTIVNKTYMIGDNVSVSCETGFKANTVHTTCNKSKLWDPQPTCTEVMCTNPVEQNGYYRTSNYISYHGNNTTSCIGSPVSIYNSTNENLTTAYTYNTTIYLECKCGFEASGPTAFTCLGDGTWGKHNSTCVKIICNETSVVNHNALIGVPEYLSVGERGNVSYNLEQFFLSDGGIEVECLVNRSLTWMRKPTFGKYYYFT